MRKNIICQRQHNPQGSDGKTPVSIGTDER